MAAAAGGRDADRRRVLLLGWLIGRWDGLFRRLARNRLLTELVQQIVYAAIVLIGVARSTEASNYRVANFPAGGGSNSGR